MAFYGLSPFSDGTLVSFTLSSTGFKLTAGGS